MTPNWWKSIKQSLKPHGFVYICSAGHALFVPQEDIKRSVEEANYEYFPMKCPTCSASQQPPQEIEGVIVS